MRNLTGLLFVFLTIFRLYGQSCDTNSLAIHKVSASVLDPSITPFEIVRHHSFFNPDCNSKNTLVFYIMGTYATTNMSLLFPKTAANNGFHVININYLNDQSATSSCQDDLDTNCYKYFHEEVIFGTDVSDTVEVDTANSIYTRSVKFLNYLSTNYPSENWSQFMNGNDIDWTKVIVAGHSQGSGHTAYLAHIFPVQRAILMSGPNEYMNNYNQVASWFSGSSITADSNYYGFGNINDEFSFDNQNQTWQVIGQDNYGDTINVTTNNCPYNNSRMLFTNDLFSGGVTPNHNCTAVDNFIPLDGNGIPEYEEAWKYMLGICDIPTYIEDIKKNTINMYPNPTRGNLTIQTKNTLSDVNITIQNTLGAINYSNRYKTLNKTTLNLNHLKSGVYFIKISTKELNQTHQLIVN